MKNMTRRNFLKGSVLTGALFLTACGGGGGTAPTEPGSAAAAGDLGLVEAGKLTCISNMYFPPFEFMDEESGEPMGFDIDISKAIAEHMGLEVNWLPSQQFDTLIPTIKSGGTADIAISGMTITDERKQEVGMSDPYVDSNQAIVVKAEGGETQESLNAEGKQIAVQAGTTGEAWAVENLPEATILPLDEVISAMTGVSTGTYDAAVFDLPVASNQIAKSFTDLTVVQEIPTGEQYGIAVSADNPALLEAVNAALAEMESDGTMDEIEKTWFGAAL